MGDRLDPAGLTPLQAGAILSSKTLADLSLILAWTLARDNKLARQPGPGQGPTASLIEPLDAASQSQLWQPGQIPFEPALLQAITRHRLEIILEPHLPELGWPDAVVRNLRQAAKQQRLRSLALLAAGIACSDRLRAEGIRCLLFKGPALALQTTGDICARGSGDVDLLVDPGSLAEAVSTLEAIGFIRLRGNFPRDLRSRWGRYGRWAGYELSMRRGDIWLDLHWALSNVRSPLPTFEAIWAEHQTLNVNGKSLVTLSQRHAFLHACAHAAKDEWMTLRHLVDIERLARQLTVEDRALLGKSKAVRLSCAVAYHSLASPVLLECTNPVNRHCRKAIAKAQWNQLRQPRARATLPWKPEHWIGALGHMLLLARTPQDWLRTVACFTVPPATFNDPTTGKDRNLGEMIRARLAKMVAKLSQWRQGGSAEAAIGDSRQLMPLPQPQIGGPAVGGSESPGFCRSANANVGATTNSDHA